MKSSCQILPGIKFIACLPCRDVPANISMSAINNIPAVVNSDLLEITFFGSPECRCVTENINNGWTQKTNLKFHSSDQLPLSEPLAFVVTDANDDSFIIGSREEPFPIFNCERISGSESDEKAGFIYEISHVEIRSLIKCEI